VLIALGILTVGLLSVAAVFPVGGFYMQKADIADRGSAIAQAVMNDIVARGMLDPSAWYVMTPAPASAAPGDPNYQFPTIDGKYTAARRPTTATFTRPLGEALSEGQRITAAAVTAPNPTIRCTSRPPRYRIRAPTTTEWPMRFRRAR
jgi:hypothetical protein